MDNEVDKQRCVMVKAALSAVLGASLTYSSPELNVR